MCKRWMGVALLAGWLGLTGRAPAQYLPDGPGAPPVADPIPESHPHQLDQGPQFPTPGPMTGAIAPYGPSEKLSLPANHSSAFPLEPRHESPYCFLHLGTIAYQRQRIGRGVTAFTDPGVDSRVDTGIVVNRNRFQPLMDLEQITPPLTWGGIGTIGYMFGNYSLELTGFWVPQGSHSTSIADRGRLSSAFVNPPAGFEGNNGLWLQADTISQTFSSEMAGGEFNVRYFSQFLTTFELLLGFRYLDYTERLDILADDEGRTFTNAAGQPNTEFIANYNSRTRNRIIGPQFGWECQKSLIHGVALGAFMKVTPGLNVANADQQLDRGDGTVGFRDTRSEYTLAFIGEAGVYLDLYLLERCRVRGGYQALALTGILEAPDQINYDLSQRGGREDNSGQVLFHGLTVQLQFLF